MKEVHTITDVHFYDDMKLMLLHVPDPQFGGEDGKQLVFPDSELIKTATHMILTFEDGTDQTIAIEPERE